MTHAETILRTLDRHLDSPRTLILYGRAALALGFEPPPEGVAMSRDVDVILTAQQSAELDDQPAFWDALGAANDELDSAGLYLTHLFEESQVILRPEWQDHLVPISKPSLRWLHLFRPGALDLLLTKMMRGLDPQDMEDAAFLIRSAQLSCADVQQAIASARIPDVPEIAEAFRCASPHILKIAASHP